MSQPIRLAIVGVGKIAHDQHLPAIAASDRFRLVGAATHGEVALDVPVFGSIDQLLASGIEIDAVAMCQPPQARFDAAVKALRARKHVLLEKPPGATLAEVEALTQTAEKQGVSLFAAWHSRYAPGVEPARAWLAGRRILSVDIEWKEDVRRWHPGQQWIWDAGGLGVFDPGINALSIATHILPQHIFLLSGQLEVPENRDAPIAAHLAMADMDGAPIRAVFDWRQTGPQSWNICVYTDAGTLLIEQGGAKLTIAGDPVDLPAEAEYPSLYNHFADIIASGAREADRSPLRLVADSFLRCSQLQVAPFID